MHGVSMWASVRASVRALMQTLVRCSARFAGRLVAVVGPILLLAAAPAARGDAPPRNPEERPVASTQKHAGQQWEVLSSPFPVLDLVLHPAGGLALLVLDDPAVPEAASPPGRKLLRWDAAEVEVLADALAPGPGRLVRRLDELWWEDDGVEDTPPRILRLLPGEAAPRPAPGDWIDLEVHDRHGLLAAPARVDVGRLELLDESLALRRSIPLPLDASRRGAAIDLRSPPVHYLPPAAAGGEGDWIVGPRTIDDRRLQAWRIDPATGDRTEIWCRLPGPEEISGTRVLRLAGRPALAAWTNSADKLGVFEKLRLRVWLLEEDRSRVGRPPVLAQETASRRWFTPRLVTADFDGDGREELIVGQPEGLGGGELLVEVFPVSPSGRIGAPRATKLDALGADWELGDVDGDGVPDLVTLDREHLAVRSGLAEHRRKAFEARPGVQVEIGALPRPPEPAGEGEEKRRDDLELHLLDVDADGRPEPVLVRTRAGGGSLVLRLLLP